MKTVLALTALGLLPLSIPAAERDQNIATCYVYMQQTKRADGARAVARLTTDLEAVQYYLMSAFERKVNTVDATVACHKLGVDIDRYAPRASYTSTQKE